jgi:demethylmenaquinone methyltransferase/2-methoxy-6-polyprenyl-1,4-benzoquinol methylase
MSSIAAKQVFFDRALPRWMEDLEQRSARLTEIFARYPIPRDGPILDVGAGTGILLPFLRGKEATVTELEISGAMLRQARDSNVSSDKTRFVQGDAHALPFAGEVFGSIHCFSVFPHFDSPERALREFARCVRTGGSLCILHLMGHEALNRIHRDAGRTVRDDVLPPVAQLANLVSKQGFRITLKEERDDLYLILATRRDCIRG